MLSGKLVGGASTSTAARAQNQLKLPRETSQTVQAPWTIRGRDLWKQLGCSAVTSANTAS